MKKPIPGRGSALNTIKSIDYRDRNVATLPNKIKCDCDRIAAKHGRNLAILQTSQPEPHNPPIKLIKALTSHFCRTCRIRFWESYKINLEKTHE